MGIIMSQDNLKKSVLKNKKYIGVFRDNDHYCPALVSAGLFERVQELLAINIKVSQKYSYVFSGLLRCAHCGQAFSGAMRKIKKAKRGTDIINILFIAVMEPILISVVLIAK